MKPKPDKQKQLYYHELTCNAGTDALMLYAEGKRRNALPYHLQAKRYESAWRAYGGKGRIALRVGPDRLL